MFHYRGDVLKDSKIPLPQIPQKNITAKNF